MTKLIARLKKMVVCFASCMYMHMTLYEINELHS
jgi:hypothetical protein